MKYAELQIETQRQAPARARSEGASLLRRAGYISSQGELTGLGRRMHAHLTELAQTRTVAEFLTMLSLPAFRTDEGEYFFQNAAGRQEILRCAACHYISRQELARSRREASDNEEPEPVEKVATPDCNTIDSLAAFLDIPTARTAKAMMYTRTADGKFIFVVIRGDTQLSDAKLRKALGEVRLATADEIAAAGASPGYASAIGLTSAMVAVDELITRSRNLVAGANEPGFHLRNTNYGRDYDADLVTDLIAVHASEACPNCGAPLAALRADLLADADGYHMENLLEALAETHHDEKGLTWPVTVSPFDVHLLHLPGKELDTTRSQAAKLDRDWEAAGISVLFDDRDERAGVKFNDADLIGCPIRATVGERAMREGMVELKQRTRTDTQLVRVADTLQFLRTLIKRSS